MADDISWLTILQIGGLSGVVAAGAKWGLDLLSDRMKRRLEGSYAALRVVVILERFTSACDAHLRNRDLQHQLGQISAAGILPKLDEFPANLDWRHFDPNLAMWALGLPASIEAAQGSCHRADWESDDYWASEGEAIRLGLEAWELAGLIRRRYGLGLNKQIAGVADYLMAERARRAKAAAGLRAQFEGVVSEKAVAEELARRGL